MLRHKKCISVYYNEEEIYSFLRSHPETSLLDCLVSFDLYLDNDQFSKSKVRDGEVPCAAHVCVMDGDVMFSPRILLELLKEAGEVPVVVAAVTPTGQVILEVVPVHHRHTRINHLYYCVLSMIEWLTHSLFYYRNSLTGLKRWISTTMRTFITLFQQQQQQQQCLTADKS